MQQHPLSARLCADRYFWWHTLQAYDDGDDWEAREAERRRQAELQQQAMAAKRKGMHKLSQR
jgi:hypothetical protein